MSKMLRRSQRTIQRSPLTSRAGWQKLNESGGSHRLSFVENVFCTPAAIDPRYDFDLQLCGTQPLPQDPVVASGAGTRWGYDIERSHGPRVTGVFARRILDGCGH